MCDDTENAIKKILKKSTNIIYKNCYTMCDDSENAEIAHKQILEMKFTRINFQNFITENIHKSL